LATNTISFTKKAFVEQKALMVDGPPIVKYREGVKYQKATFHKNTISLGFEKTFKGQRFNEVLGHWPEMSFMAFDKIAKNRVSQIELGYYNKAANLLVGDFFIDYILPMVETHNRDIKGVKTRWRRVVSFIGHRQLGDVTRLELLQFLNGLAKEVKGSTVNRHLSLFSLIFSTAVDLDLIFKSPCKGIKKWPEDNTRDRVLNTTESYYYIDKALCIDSFHSKALLVSLFLGLRIGNVLDIRRDMIDEKFEILSLPKTKNGRHYHVTLNEPAKYILMSCAELSWNEWLFPSAIKDGSHISSPRNCHRIISDYVQAKVGRGTPFTIHDLRRTYASRQIELTGDVRLVQANLFHQNVTTTERYAFHQKPQIAQASQDTAVSLLAGHQHSFNLSMEGNNNERSHSN
jgi:integrase